MVYASEDKIISDRAESRDHHGFLMTQKKIRNYMIDNEGAGRPNSDLRISAIREFKKDGYIRPYLIFGVLR
jgi:hypothetical protein